MNNKNEKKYRTLIIFALLLSIACMTVGYSAFAQELEIKSTMYLNNNKWSIRFNDLKEISLIGTKEIATSKLSESIIELALSFEHVGDKAIYSFDVENNGTIDAVLSGAPIIEFLPTNTSENLNINIKYENGSELEKGDSLEINTKKKMILTIEYLNADKLLLNDNENEVNLKVIILYNQKG